MNELESDKEYVPTMLNNEDERLEIPVDLKELKVVDWNENNGFIHIWSKVCDEGVYTLLDADRKPIWQIYGYVPNKLIPPYEKGYGNYLEMKIEKDGSLHQWKETSDFSDFIKYGHEPKTIKNNKWQYVVRAYFDILSHQLNKKELIWLVQKLNDKYEIPPEQFEQEIKP